MFDSKIAFTVRIRLENPYRAAIFQHRFFAQKALLLNDFDDIINELPSDQVIFDSIEAKLSHSKFKF